MTTRDRRDLAASALAILGALVLLTDLIVALKNPETTRRDPRLTRSPRVIFGGYVPGGAS